MYWLNSTADPADNGEGDVQSFFDGHKALRISFLIGTVVFYLAFTYTKRVYFHPLSGIPGPSLAAATQFYEGYFNIFREGFCQKFLSLHKEYKSPVVRIGTNHVHIGDPAYYHTIHNPGPKYAKAPGLYKKLGINGALLTITEPDRHKTYHSTVNQLFSRRSSDDLQPKMAAEVLRAADLMALQGKAGEHCVIQRVYRALAADMTALLMFGDTLGFIDSPHYADHYHQFMNNVDRYSVLLWPNVLGLGFAEFDKAFDRWLEKENEIQKSGKEPEGTKKFLGLMFDWKKSIGESFNAEEIFEDSFNYMTAGMDGNGHVLSFVTWSILTNPDVKAKLEKELREARQYIREFNHRRIMALPYLTAVLKESLRLANTAPAGLPREVPQQGVNMGGYHIPAGTMITICHPVVERNENIFPDPLKFDPERWLGEDSSALEKWLVAFSKGRRQCIGKNIAWMLLYTNVAVFFDRFEMEIYETNIEDMFVVDLFAPRRRAPIKVRVLKDRWEGLT
ncbi:unnamed protein product [Penicillium olsonii]|uniref:Cytochrome P450 n=1 Tax=Penicillium olsonii TaxID=99116 RepID=A0A9W4N270_PENOL|nr:unnamed protein product [Penicillium olsonii]CAG8238408.1 unnamed protein product [Penicillium olsonii]